MVPGTTLVAEAVVARGESMQTTAWACLPLRDPMPLVCVCVCLSLFVCVSVRTRVFAFFACK